MVSRVGLCCWLLLLPLSVAADSMRCEHGLVRSGDRGWQVERACGPPDIRERLESMVLVDGHVISTLERWHYNLGPRRLVREVELADGRVTRIGTGGYGYRRLPGGPCRPGTIRRGMTRLELLGRCGDPDVRETLAPRSYFHARLHARRIGAAREEWVYEFGPGDFTRIVTLEGGRVTGIEILSRR